MQTERDAANTACHLCCRMSLHVTPQASKACFGMPRSPRDVVIQGGYSLVELMIAISLGLIVVAAAMAVLLSAQRLVSLQNAMDELQQNANLAVGLISFELRQSHLNMDTEQGINNKNHASGIIFSAANLPPSMASNASSYQGLWTQQDSGVAATVQKSDQLLVQYRPEYVLGPASATALGGRAEGMAQVYSAGFDCEGKKIEFAAHASAKGQASGQRIIVNRYYLKKDPQQIKGEPTGYSLFCERGDYAAGDRSISGLTRNGGQQIMKRVDAFKLRLGVRAPDGKLSYLSVDQYLALMPNSVTQPALYYNIVSIELGLLVRSSTPLGADSILNPEQEFQLLGNRLQLQSTAQSSKYLRQKISQVVALRNALGVQGGS